MKAKEILLNGHTSHVIPNPIGLKGKVIKVVPSYFCGGVLLIRDLSSMRRYCNDSWRDLRAHKRAIISRSTILHHFLVF